MQKIMWSSHEAQSLSAFCCWEGGHRFRDLEKSSVMGVFSCFAHWEWHLHLGFYTLWTLNYSQCGLEVLITFFHISKDKLLPPYREYKRYMSLNFPKFFTTLGKNMYLLLHYDWTLNNIHIFSVANIKHFLSF